MVAYIRVIKNFFPNKKYILTLLIASCISFSLANPIMPPPIISELHFSENGWQIEMVFDEIYGIENLDYIRLVGLNDTARFNPGITVYTGEILVITENDLQSSFYIDPTGDYIALEMESGSNWWAFDEYGICFGEYTNPYTSLGVSAPISIESVAYQRFYHPYNNDFSYWLVKEKPQTIGSNAFDVQKRVSFQGYVFDMNLNPLSNVKLDYCHDDYYSSCYSNPTVPLLVTDEDGYFSTVNMFSRKYHIIFIDDDGDFIDDTIVSIECDSNNYFEFVMDSTWVGFNEIKPLKEISLYNFPNPFSQSTTIVADINNTQVSSNAVIKIYNQQGELLKILPIKDTHNSNKFETNFYLSDFQIKPGTYIYTLEVDHKKIASNKMIIIQ